MVEITVNGEPKLLTFNCNLEEAIAEWQINAENFAIAVNDQFIPKPNYASTQLDNGDRVEILIPMQGG